MTTRRPAGENGKRFLQPALRSFIKNDDIEHGCSRKNLRDGFRAGHPDGAEIQQRITAFDGASDGDHLAKPHRAVPAADQPAAEIGTGRVQSLASSGQQSLLLFRHPVVSNTLLNELFFLFIQFAEAFEACVDAMAVDGLQRGVFAKPTGDFVRPHFLLDGGNRFFGRGHLRKNLIGDVTK